MKKLSACLVLGLALCASSFFASATSLSDYAENKLVDVLFRGTAFSESSPANYYVALYTSACSDSTPGTEVSGGGYARVAIVRSTSTWNGTQGNTTGASSGTSGTISNASAITFPTATADWGAVTYWGIRDASSSGNQILCSAITTPRTITAGSTPSFSAGALTFQIDN